MAAQFSDFVQWVFYGLISGCSLYLVNILGGLKSSVDELNIKMATIIEKTSGHERRIERLENKLEESK